MMHLGNKGSGKRLVLSFLQHAYALESLCFPLLSLVVSTCSYRAVAVSE